MRLRQIGWLVVVPVALVLSVGARAVGEEKKGEDLLQSKGLRKIGQFFALADETALKRKLHELEPLRRKVIETQRKAVNADKIVEQKKQLLIQCYQQHHQLSVQLNSANNIGQHNHIVDMMNELTDRIALLEKPGKEDKDAKTTRAAATEVSQHYVELIMQVRKQCKEVKAKYDALAADDTVKKAIDEVNKEDSSSCKLGPGSDFNTVDKTLKKLEGSVLSETIQMLHEDGDVWSVPVTFNGLHSRDLMVDTGASSIVLPYQVAVEVGMSPSESDPTFTAVMADGHTVECKLVYAKTVRVGKFTVEHVECGIMPAKCADAAAVLGQSFLKHFTFRVDNRNGKLIMAQVGGKQRRPGQKPEPGKTEETGEDKTAIPNTADREKGGPEQIAKLLKLDNERPADRLDFADSDGNPIQMARCKSEPMENIRKLAGEPDEVYKIPMKSNDPTEKAAPWKMYSWGQVYVLADETGHARYYTVVKEKAKEKGKQ